ncbi:uncharacterized protein LOC128039991 [Gossypium raimondii]|uniref:uncharacterized protein LOC128039991 n=1 Tax=Gossypium raimondii TaxID=29730 RepID=UPI00227C67A5|nr:uncharacterized protein LOC128039991 [Gossypium raimondii]
MQDQLQQQMQEQFEKIQQKMMDKMAESQGSMMTQLTQFLIGGKDKGKGPMANVEEEGDDGLLYPPGFTPPCVGSGSSPENNPANPIVPDFDETVEKEKTKEELPKQLEERWNWIEEKFKAMETTERCHGINAKDLSLVSDLVLPYKFKMPDFKKYNGTTCPEAHITMFYRRMTGHVAEMVPDRITLQNMEKKSDEGFRQYVQRWRESAVQVQPTLLEREMTVLFVNTLKAPFITHMLGSATKNFADIVMSVEMIESAVTSGKINVGKNNRRQNSKKKSKVNNVNTYNKSITVNPPRKVVAGQQGSSKQESGPPYLKWYDANAQCDYHAGVAGHSIEHCTAFKKLVEKLIKMGVVKVDDSSGIENPLPNHADARVNMVGEGTRKKVKENIAEVKIPLKRVWKEMVGRGCEKFRALIQSMMDNGEIEFFEEVEGKESICASESETKIPKVNHPVIIISRPKVTEVRAQVTPKVVIQKPTKFSYKDSRKVPWNYDCEVIILGKETSISVVKENKKTGSYTNTEEYCSRIKAQAESVEGKVIAAEQKEEKRVELRSLINEPIKEEEVIEILRFLKHSEYSVVEQLHK